VPEIPPELDAVVMRGLKRDPAERFATARDMARALEACGPMATPTQVGEWVESTAGTALAVRARIVSEVEQIDEFPDADSSSRPPRILASSEEPTVAEVRTEGAGVSEVPDFQPQRRRRVVVLTALVAFLFGAVVLWAILPERSRTEGQRVPAAPPAEAEPSGAASQAELPPPPASSAESTASAAESAQAPKPDASAVVKPAATSGQKKTKPPAPKTDCDPPYTIDQEGHRRYKMECL